MSAPSDGERRHPAPGDPSGEAAGAPTASGLAEGASVPAPATPPTGGRHLRTALWLAGLLAVPTTLWLSGALDYLRDTARVRADVSTLGPLAPVAWVLLHATLEGLGVPATFIVIAAMVLFSKPVALAVCVVGSAGGMAFGFYLARAIARDWVSARLPARFRAWETHVSEHAFLVSLLMRSVLFLAPGPAYVMGLSRARFVPCLVGAALGCIPGLWLMVYWGPEAAALLAHVPAWGWVAALLVVASAFAWRRRSPTNT